MRRNTGNGQPVPLAYLKQEAQARMAKILENPHGGRRMIRLSGQDVGMVVALFQQVHRQANGSHSPITHDDLTAQLETFPFYLPEDVA